MYIYVNIHYIFNILLHLRIRGSVPLAFPLQAEAREIVVRSECLKRCVRPARPRIGRELHVLCILLRPLLDKSGATSTSARPDGVVADAAPSPSSDRLDEAAADQPS